MFEHPVGTRKPVCDLHVVVVAMQQQHDRAEIALDTCVVELESEVDLLEPPASDAEEVGALSNLLARYASASCCGLPGHEVPHQHAFRDEPPSPSARGGPGTNHDRRAARNLPERHNPRVEHRVVSSGIVDIYSEVGLDQPCPVGIPLATTGPCLALGEAMGVHGPGNPGVLGSNHANRNAFGHVLRHLSASSAHDHALSHTGNGSDSKEDPVHHQLLVHRRADHLVEEVVCLRSVLLFDQRVEGLAIPRVPSDHFAQRSVVYPPTVEDRIIDGREHINNRVSKVVAPYASLT